jgi:hypothetical protein
MLHDLLDSQPHATIAQTATFHDLMAGVGYLLFQWSLLDTSLDEEIGQLRRASGDPMGAPGRTRTVNERLAEWRALLGRGRRRHADHYAAVERVAASIQELQRRHMLIAAGFVAGTVDAAPAIGCAPIGRTGGVGERMTLRDLRGTIEDMEMCRSEMALLRGLCEY